MNTLYYGDNLDILRRYIKDETVDLVYLDPPFNSAQDYHVLFAEKDGKRSAAQIKAFEDTWHWDQTSSFSFHEVVEQGGELSRTMQAFRQIMGENDMLAYLSMMAPRLHELRRVMKDTASIYLHCDPTASHYLKLVMDGVFGPENYRNEIVWKRTTAHNDPKRYGSNTDRLLYYAKSKNYTWNAQHTAHDDAYIARFTHVDPNGRRWADDNLSAKGLSGGGYAYEYKGVTSLWRCPPETMARLDAEGRLYFTSKGGIRIKRYLDENEGRPLQELWEDISPLNSQAKERLGYPTQKPEALLERILLSSSNAGDVVFDPFCGCGASIAAAQKLKRQWIGIDVTHLAIGLIKTRLQDTYGPDITKTYNVLCEPTSLPDAVALAAQDKYQFQYWALGLVGARPAEQKKGADRGIDGRLYFHDGDAKGSTKQVIFSVKGGHTDVTHVRDLVGVLDRAKAQIGVLISLQDPTSHMRTEAASAGFYTSPWYGVFPRMQLLTIADLLSGKRVEMPNSTGVNQTFKQAPKARPAASVTQPALLNAAVPVPGAADAEDSDEDAWDDADEVE